VGPANAGIEFAQVTVEVANRWMALAGKDLAKIEADIDKTPGIPSRSPSGFARSGSSCRRRREVKTVHNVGGYLPGDTAEYIVIGAHYDHLGLGEQYSLRFHGRHGPSRRRRQRFRNPRCDGTGTLVFRRTRNTNEDSCS